MPKEFFSIPVIVERYAMVNVKSSSLKAAIRSVEKMGVKSKVTALSTQNVSVRVNHEKINEYNPAHWGELGNK